MGGGGGEAGELCPAWGILSRERGDLGLVSLAGHIRVWIWRVPMARHFGGFAWRVHLASQVGSFSQWVFKARKTYVVEQRKVMKCIMVNL